MPSVLIIEDDEAIQRLYGDAFTGSGYAVTPANDVAAALIQLEGHAFDVILIDLMMPGQSGLEFLKTFRQQYPASQAVIIIASNLDNPVITAKLLALNIDHYFVKPNSKPADIVAFATTTLANRTAAAPPPAGQTNAGNPSAPSSIV